MVLENLFELYESIWGNQGKIDSWTRTLNEAWSIESLNVAWSHVPDELKTESAILKIYQARAQNLTDVHTTLKDPLAGFISGALDKWLDSIKDLDKVTPDNSKEKLSELSAKIIEIFAVSAAVDIGLGMLPNGAGEASSTNTKELLKWLGFGAVLAAIAHDPVKIGVLRPYQNFLEMTFRNRRPEYVGIIKAYTQRSLSTIPITDTDQITDEVMDKIEVDNNSNMDKFGAMWGYNDEWITIEKDASTRAVSLGGLMAMARLGYYNKGLTIFSLWTAGIDRRVMKQAMSAVETSRDVGMWKGFRSMVEPAYTQGLIEAEDLKEYWTKILVPQDVQDWAMLRLTKSREKYLDKEKGTAKALTKNLTRADFTKAYELGFIDKPQLTEKLTGLGYDADEIDIIIKLADHAKSTTPTSKLKHLPLSAYEKAHSWEIIQADKVLSMMEGVYSPEDIEIEKQFLAYDDLGKELIPGERDLTAAQLTTAYVSGIIDEVKLSADLLSMGYDDEETSILTSIAKVRKGVAVEVSGKAGNAAVVAKERDLTQSQILEAYRLGLESLEDTKSYLKKLGYDDNEVNLLISIADIKKGMKATGGLKRLPLSDYEKCEAYNLITAEQVIERMQGEYSEFDIGLEKLMLANAIARKG